MLLGTLMAAHGAVDPSYSGIITNDDFVLAVNVSGEGTTDVDTYAVAQGAIEGVDAQMSPATSDKQYIRAGMSSTKTGTQRTFKATGDRYIGDEFQDYVFSHAMKYGVGQTVVVDYVFFCILNGKGEQGKVAVIVNSDGSGTAGNTAAVDIDLKKTGDMPTEYTYTGAGATPVVPLTVVSVAGALTGDTSVYVNPLLTEGNSYKYKTAATVTLPTLDAEPGAGWADWNGIVDITATTGNEIAIVEVDSSGKAKKGGKAIVTSNEG